MFFSLVFFFPLLPPVFENSQIHINFVILGLSLAYILISFYGSFTFEIEVKGVSLVIIFYYLLCQMLLVPSLIMDFINGTAGISSVFSFFRPLLLCINFLCLYNLVKCINADKLINFLKILVIVSFVYVVCELFFIEYFESVIHILFKREWRTNLVGVSTTFFGTTYYSGFVFYSIFVLLFSYTLKFRSISNISCSLLALLLIIFSQSKSIILSAVISILLLFLIHSKKLFLLTLIVFSIIFAILVINIDYIFSILAQYNLTIVKQIKVLFFAVEQSETLNARTGQIAVTLINIAETSGIFGLGLSPSESLESWVALFLYRYGVLGVPLFLVFCFMLSLYSLKVMKNESSEFSFVGLAALMWLITLPLTQMSSAMIELGKTSYVTAFILALLCTSSKRKSNYDQVL